MTPHEPTAEARAAAEQIAGMIYEAAMVADSCEIPCPGIDQMAPLLAAALDAYAKERVEQAEKERNYWKNASIRDCQRIASLEAELARVREERKLDSPIIKAQAAIILLLRARLSPERLEKVAQAIEQTLYGVGDPDDVTAIFAVLQRELMDSK